MIDHEASTLYHERYARSIRRLRYGEEEANISMQSGKGSVSKAR